MRARRAALFSILLLVSCRSADGPRMFANSWSEGVRSVLEGRPAGSRPSLRAVTLELRDVDPRVRDDVREAARSVMASDPGIEFVEFDVVRASERVIEERSAPRALAGAPRSGRIRPASARVVVDAMRDDDLWVGAVELVDVESGVVHARQPIEIRVEGSSSRERPVPGFVLRGSATRIDPGYWDRRVDDVGWIRVFEEFEALRDDSARDDKRTRSALDREFETWCARRGSTQNYSAWRNAAEPSSVREGELNP